MPGSGKSVAPIAVAASEHNQDLLTPDNDPPDAQTPDEDKRLRVNWNCRFLKTNPFLKNLQESNHRSPAFTTSDRVYRSASLLAVSPSSHR